MHELSGHSSPATHRVAEGKPGVAQLQVFEQRVQFAAVEAAPGAEEVLPRLRLLSRRRPVDELVEDEGRGGRRAGAGRGPLLVHRPALACKPRAR